MGMHRVGWEMFLWKFQICSLHQAGTTHVQHERDPTLVPAC